MAKLTAITRSTQVFSNMGKFANNDIRFVCDIANVAKEKRQQLEDMYTNDELEALLMSYVVLKTQKGKIAKLSKFVDKMLEK